MIDSFDWNGQQQASREWREQIRQVSSEEYLELLQESGWLDELDADHAEQLCERLRTALDENPTFCFYELAATEFDSDCIEEAGTDDSCSYYSIVMQLAHDSRSLFNPGNVVDELDRTVGIAKVAFEHSGQRYECEVPLDGTWFQDPVLEMVNQALADSGTNQRFITLPTCNQIISLALMQEKVYSSAVRLGLIPDVHFYTPSAEQGLITI